MMYHVCRQKTRLFAVLPLENRHQIVLYRSASQLYLYPPTKSDESSVDMAIQFLIAALPRGG